MDHSKEPYFEEMITRKVKTKIPKMKQEGKAKQMEAKRKRASSRQGPCLIIGNPRILKAHLFGGKDRHSKVYTIKGLRDRRIRLSAPTAIQLYDLQNRLGLTQPSKVIDWLIQVTCFDIDKLPPLHFQSYFDPNHSILHQSSFIVSQICPFDAALKAKNEETERVLVQKLSPFTNHDSVSAIPRNAHFQVSSFSSPLMEANLASASSSSSAPLLLCPVTKLSEVSPVLRDMD